MEEERYLYLIEMNEAQEVKLKKVGEKGNINGFKNRLKVYND